MDYSNPDFSTWQITRHSEPSSKNIAAQKAFIQPLINRPYSLVVRLEISERYARLGYPDLAAGEAYMALLLIDEVRDESGEYHEEALQEMLRDAGEKWSGVVVDSERILEELEDAGQLIRELEKWEEST
jgi:hypothetical protein